MEKNIKQQEHDKIFRNRLAELRKEKGLSYQQLQELTNISRSTLQRYETKDSSNITIDKLNALASAFDVSPEYLFGLESRVLPYSYYKDLLPLLKSLNYDLIYDEKTEYFSLCYYNKMYPITPAEIHSIVDTTTSYLQFKLSEVMNKPSVN